MDPDLRVASEPLISVVIPAFNAGPLLDLALDSVLAQTWTRVEVIVVDDGSTDDLAERVARRGGRVRYLRQTQAGPGAARNAGVRMARGDYVAFLDSDDLWAPETLARQMEVARQHPESGLVACDGQQIEGSRDVAPPLLCGPLAARMRAAGGQWTGQAYGELLEGTAISTPGQVLVSRRVLEEVGPFTERRDEPEDYDLWLRIAERREITLHDARLVSWRYQPSSVSGPAALRPLRWALMDVAMLQRHLTCVAPARRPAVRAALRQRVRLARQAWLLGRIKGMAAGRDALRRLARAAPWSPRPRLWWLATWAPACLVERRAVRGIAAEDLAELQRSVAQARRAASP